MKKLIFCLLSTFAFSSYADFHYPEERTYTSTDRGYKQYGAPSLHHTGRYALTFDDGPHATNTPKILDLLKQYNAKATFFVITSRLTEANFKILKRILDEGHILASHGSVHDNSNNVTKAQWKSRVKQSFLDLKKIYNKAGHKFTKHYYRFPYAAYGLRSDHHHMNTLKEISQELMKENCIHFTFWDIDSGDWVPGMSASEVANNIKANQEGGRFIGYKTVRDAQGRSKQVKVNQTITDPIKGGVILQHDIQANSVEATRQILKYAKDNKLEISPLDEIDEFKITRKCEL